MALAGTAKATVEIPVTATADASLLMVESFMSVLRTWVRLLRQRLLGFTVPGIRATHISAPCCLGDIQDIDEVADE
jgi:hypothetical protein